MSIRLRLTLLYSLILALTLIAFSAILYVTQARTSLHESKKALAKRAEFLIEGPLSHGDLDKLSAPARFGNIFQIRSPDEPDQVLHRSPGLGEAPALPLSPAGWQALRRGQSWVEIETLETERVLIHSQPFNFPQDDLFRGQARTPLILQVAASLADQDRDLHSLGQILLIGSSLALIVACGAGWLLAGFTLQPIKRLRQTAAAIGSEQDFNRRVAYAGPTDEIGQLAATFNDMLAQLQAAYRQVEETLHTQRRFVADASHELRTPLTTLRGNIGLLQRRPAISPEDRADVLADMVDETERLMRLAAQLLALARADAGRPWQPAPLQLKPLLEEVCQQLQLLAPRRAIMCRPDPRAAVLADPDALKQILLILLDNALKHTPPEAAITLAAALHNGQVAIRVSDNGPGIPPAHLPHIFERFYRGDAARSSPGAGLGLAIAGELAKAQHAALAVESQPGQGCAFTLTFPTANP